MTERFLHHVRVERPAASETVGEARERLREKFPRGAVRRMTHLGLLAGEALEGAALSEAEAVVYATSYGETRALEDFVASFPAASPSLFQTSIHPSAIEQVLIGRQQAVARLWPLAGRKRLVEQALLTALLEPAERVVLVGGEERGTWLLENGAASDRTFAFGALLTRERAGAKAKISRASGGVEADTACPTLAEFADALAESRALSWRGGGEWRLEWL
jgi:hypothetical protein